MTNLTGTSSAEASVQPTTMTIALWAHKSCKGCTQWSQRPQVQENHLTRMSSDSLYPWERLCSGDGFCLQGLESQDTDWQSYRILSFYLPLWDAHSFSCSHGNFSRGNQEKWLLQGQWRCQWDLCGAVQTGEADKGCSSQVWLNH